MPTITSDATLSRDLVASLNRQDGISAGLTWREFQAAMTLLGVGPEDRIASIEFGCTQFGTGRLMREDAPDGIEIRESTR